MNAYQLSCGHWQNEPASCQLGAILGCTRCNTLRAVVIGMTTAPEWAPARRCGARRRANKRSPA